MVSEKYTDVANKSIQSDAKKIRRNKLNTQYTSFPSVSDHITTRCHRAEDHDMTLHSRENLKSHIITL